MFVSPPPSVDWPQVADPTTQTSIGGEDMDWAVLGVGEEAAAKAAGKRSAASKRHQAIFTLSDDDIEEGEDADIFRLIPRKRRRQLESMEHYNTKDKRRRGQAPRPSGGARCRG